MARYIDADALINILNAKSDMALGTPKVVFASVVKMVELLPPADVAPIADTVRKMQERLTLEFDRLHKSNFMTPEVRQWIIDQIAKEMVENA